VAADSCDDTVGPVDRAHVGDSGVHPTRDQMTFERA
jgi:hypothetical protein